MTLPFLAAIAIFAAVVLIVLAVASVWGREQWLVAERVARHSNVPSAVAGQAAGTAELLLDKDYSSFEALNRILRRSSYPERVALDLARAAVPLRVGEYLFIRWITALALGGLGLTFLRLNVVVCLVLGVIGYFLPRIYVSLKEKSRSRKFEDQLVDALMMMANSLKSGSSFLQAIDLVAHEQPAPISQEFARVVAEANVGASVENSLLDLSQRVRSYDLYLIVTAMLVQREVGGNLAEVLENIAHTIRERQRILRQMQVETAETRMSGYVIGVLPVVLLFILSIVSPSYSEVLFTGAGQFFLVAGAVMEALGFYVIHRIVSIEV